MGEPIKIVLTAETGQAVAALRDFLNNTNAGLKQVSIGAQSTGAHIAGMSYYFRSGIDGIRLALADGGPRAGFYALDEAVRGLIASGMELSTIAPVVGIVAAAAAAGVLVWREWTSATREAEKAQKDLETQMKGVATIFDQLHNLQKAGPLSPEAVQKNLDLMSGKPQMYKRKDGSLTTEATTETPVAPGIDSVIQNQKATALEVQKYIQDQLSVPGKITASMVAADAKNKELLEKAHTELLDAIEQEKAKIHDRYQAERDEIDKTAKDMGNLLTPQRQADDDAAKALLLQQEVSEQQEVDFKAQQKEQQAAQEDFKKGQDEIAKSIAAVNEGLARQQADFKADAEEAKKVNDEKQRGVEEQFRITLEILEAEKRRQEILTHPSGVRNTALDAANGMAQMFDKSSPQKTAASKNLLDLQSAGNRLQDQMDDMQSEPPGTFKRSDIDKLQKQIEQNKQLQIKAAEDVKTAEAQINDQRLAGAANMFGVMAQTAKAFGNGGFIAYKAFAIAQATIDTARAAIAAYQATVGIPYIGPVLAPIAAAAAVAAGAAQIAEIESASPREFGGPVEAGMPYIVGEKRPELFVPDTDGHIMPSVPRTYSSATRSSTSSSSSQGAPKIMVNLYDDHSAMLKNIKQNPDYHHAIIEIAKRNIHIISPNANK